MALVLHVNGRNDDSVVRQTAASIAVGDAVKIRFSTYARQPAVPTLCFGLTQIQAFSFSKGVWRATRALRRAVTQFFATDKLVAVER